MPLLNRFFPLFIIILTAFWITSFSDHAHAQPITGPYIAGEGGASLNQANRIMSTPNRINHWRYQALGGFPDGRDKWQTGGVGIGSAGYGFGDGFRLEMEGNYRSNDYAGFFTNTLKDDRVGGKRKTYGMMANALYDLDVGMNCIYPYFGAGIGYGWTTLNTNFAGHEVGGPGSTMQQVRGKYGNFAYQGIFGLSFPIPRAVGLSVTAEYRFWTMFGTKRHFASSQGSIGGTVNDVDVISNNGERFGGHNTRTDFNHSLMLGLRYEFDPPPPPPIPHVADATPPPPTPKQSYRIYFNYREATLTDKARLILNHAAQSEPHVLLSQIIISNYDKNSSEPPPQQEELHDTQLLLKRTEVIKEELIRDGISGGKIKTFGFWEPDAPTPKIANNKQDSPRAVKILFR